MRYSDKKIRAYRKTKAREKLAKRVAGKPYATQAAALAALEMFDVDIFKEPAPEQPIRSR